MLFLYNTYISKRILAFALMFPLSFQVFSQITFQKSTAFASGSGMPRCTFQSLDGGYFNIYTTNTSMLSINRLDVLGETEWTRTYSTGTNYQFQDALQASDSNIFIIGGDSSGYFLVTKIDNNGNLLWFKKIGGSLYDFSSSIIENNNNGILITGVTRSFGAGGADVYLAKIDFSGNLSWTKTYGSAIDEIGMDIINTFDNGFMIMGAIIDGNADILLLRTDSAGSLLWSKSYDSGVGDAPKALIQTNDSNFVIIGDIAANPAALVLEVDSSGNIIRSRKYEPDNVFYVRDIIQSSDGGFAIVGWLRIAVSPLVRPFIIKTSRSGNLEWLKYYFVPNTAGFQQKIIQTTDLGYLLSGRYCCFIGTFQHLIKTDSLGDTFCNVTDTFISDTVQNLTIKTLSLTSSTGGIVFNDSLLLVSSPPIDSFICFNCTIPKNIISDTLVCAGDSLSFNLEPGSDYEWHPGIYLSDSTIQGPDIVPYSTLDYTLSYIDTNSCLITDSFTISVFNPPSIDTIYGTTYVCPQDTNINYWVQDSVGSSFNWVINGGIISTGQGIDSITANWDSSSTGYVAVIEITPDGCVGDTVFFPVNINVVWTPIAPVGTDSLCYAPIDSFTYTTSYTFGANYYWQLQGGKILSGDSTPIVVIQWDTVGTYPLSYIEENITIDTICYNSSDTLWITVLPLPIKKTISGDMQVCDFDTGMIYGVNNTSGSTYTWNVQGGAVLSGNGTNSVTVDWNSTGTYVLSVVEINKFGCIGDTMDTLVSVFKHPAPLGIFGDSIVCASDSSNIKYWVNGSGGSTYNWILSNGTIDSGQGSDTVNITWLLGNFGTIKLVELSQDSCLSDTLSLSIVLDNPMINIVVVSDKYVDDKNILIKWSIDNGIHFNGQYNIYRRARHVDSGFIFLTATLNNSYVDKGLSTSSYSYEYKVIGINSCGDTVGNAFHNSILLNGTTDEKAKEVSLVWNNYLNWPLGVDRYEVWRKLDNETNFSLFPFTGLDTVKLYSNGGDGYYHCYRIKAYESGDTATSWSNEICLDFKHALNIPNAFSPNQDGVNDTWVIENLELQGENTLEIYNRWGNQIYQTKNYDNSFDGNRQNIDPYAQELPDGNYYYILKVSERFGYVINTYRGSVLILR
ncbi:MAG: gliding motility-associated C-terminal domain-containing protein [Bacteroidetes bacterium]|nr:gliding motility-associated C-terminal domain-containing protein [Bacteroidota bacterium]